MPGPFIMEADARSITAEGIEVADWAQSHLGVRNRVAADTINRLLIGSFGMQNPVTDYGDDVYVAPVFYDDTVNPDVLSKLAAGRIQYVVMDMRMSQLLPQWGKYVESGDPPLNGQPLPEQAVHKFDGVPGVNELLDSGDIVIYDVRVLLPQDVPGTP
jgi:hypothetical protein